MMPLVWDFDLAERSGNAWSRCHTKFMDQLFDSSNRAYVSEFVRVWCQIRETFVQDIHQELNAFMNAELSAMQDSYRINNAAYGLNNYFANQISSRKSWFTNRYRWLDQNILALRVPNDVNLDGVVDIGDVTDLIGAVLGTNEVFRVCADLNGDDVIDIEDITVLVNKILAD